MGRMIYGVVCFGFVFACVGTVLGGVWANDSWGRFWGWDPKENGALLIVLWGLIIMHAKTGRYIRDLGVAVGAVMLGMITAFSWWGVNLLGVGLHSYGFTSGIWRMLAVYWSVETLVVLLGIILWVLEGAGNTPDEPTPNKAAPKKKRRATAQ
jgi:cytochrome c biogenesis factor